MGIGGEFPSESGLTVVTCPLQDKMSDRKAVVKNADMSGERLALLDPHLSQTDHRHFPRASAAMGSLYMLARTLQIVFRKLDRCVWVLVVPCGLAEG